MAKYKLLAVAFINDMLLQPGAEVEYDGEPGDNLYPLDDAAKEAVAAAKKRREEKAAALAVGAGAGLNDEVMKLITSTADAVADLRIKFDNAIARLTAIEGAPSASIDTSAFAAKSDVDELDAGLQIYGGRLDEVEGTLAALASRAGVGGQVSSPPVDPPPSEVATEEPPPAAPDATE